MEPDSQELPPETPPTTETSNIDQSALLQQALQATQEARIAAENDRLRLQNELAELQRQRNTPAPVEEFTSEQFFANPGAYLNQAIARQIAPLQQSANQLLRQNTYAGLKAQFRIHPTYAKWVSLFESNLDQVFSNSNVEVNANNIANVLNSMIGNAVASNPSLLQDQTPAPVNNTPTPPAVITPPHLRPSAPATRNPSAPNAPKATFTEEERRLMRENKMTEDQWDHFRKTGNMPGTGFTPKTGGK